jgi:hypothetical protein
MPLNATAAHIRWWQQQRSVVLTQRAGLLFTRYPFLLRTQVAHATRKPKRSITIDRVKKPYNYKVSVPWLARWAR